MGIDLDTLSAELRRKWGDDAAQHALLRIVEKGWHLDPGENQVGHFARVVARHYALDRKGDRIRQRLVDSSVDYLVVTNAPATAQAPTQARRAEARQELSRLLVENPTAAARAMTDNHTEAAALMGVAVGTVKSRLSRRRK